MIDNRSTISTRLHVEKLEPRSLMAVVGATPDLLPSNPDGSSDMPGDGFPGQVSAIAAASVFGSLPAPGFTTPGGAPTVPVDGILVPSASSAPAATTGVGQMTITTGANTPGLGSFATSTAGFGSEFGGRS